MEPGSDLAAVLQEYRPRILAYFARRCSCSEDVEDLAQEVACAILKGYVRFAGRSSLSTWVYAICRNTFANHRYYRNRQGKILQALKDSRVEVRWDGQAELTGLLETLPAADRFLYGLYYGSGMSVRQVAVALDRPEGTVKYMLSRLRSRVRQMLE